MLVLAPKSVQDLCQATWIRGLVAGECVRRRERSCDDAQVVLQHLDGSGASALWIQGARRHRRGGPTDFTGHTPRTRMRSVTAFSCRHWREGRSETTSDDRRQPSARAGDADRWPRSESGVAVLHSSRRLLLRVGAAGHRHDGLLPRERRRDPGPLCSSPPATPLHQRDAERVVAPSRRCRRRSSSLSEGRASGTSSHRAWTRRDQERDDSRLPPRKDISGREGPRSRYPVHCGGGESVAGRAGAALRRWRSKKSVMRR